MGTLPAQPESDLPLIRASELADYDFCRRAWWLRTVRKEVAANYAGRKRGVDHHHRHTLRVRAAFQWRRLGIFLLGGGALLFVVLWWVYFS